MSHQSIDAFRSRLQIAATYLILIVGLALGVSLRSAQAQEAPTNTTATPVSGDISADTTWTVAKSPYQVTALLRVQPGATLTIEPGVVVEVADAKSIVVYGNLIAEGTANAPILFTGVTKAPGAWFGINAGNTTQAPAQLSFRYVTVEYTGYLNAFNGGGLRTEAPAAITIENSTFRQGGSNGFYASLRPNSSLQISDTAFLDNQLEALRFEGSLEYSPVFSNLSAAGNGNNAVSFRTASVVTGTVTLDMPGAGMPYQMLDGFSVKDGSRLIIQPGVVLQVSPSFSVYGELTALGTAAKPIRFTRGGQESNWWGLDISGVFGSYAKAQLDHVIIEYGGKSPGGSGTWDGNLIVDTAVVSVTNSIIRNGGLNGIANMGGTLGQPHSLYVADTQILNNQANALFGTYHLTNHAVTATGNGFDGIAPEGPVAEDEVWANAGLPYLIEKYGGVSSGGTLTIEPGVEIRFGKDAVFVADGNLMAVGTPEQPIVFTGTQAQPGWWRGISAHGLGATLVLRHCDVGYGGAVVGSPQPAALLELFIPVPFVSECRLHDGAGPAVFADAGPRRRPIVQHNRIENNAFGVENNEGAGQFNIDARNNWWGAASGPTHPSNPNGTGAAVSDGVLFDPWLTSPDQEDSGLIVKLLGPGVYAPGQTTLYALYYENRSNVTLKDAVLRVILPANSDYANSTGGAIFWPARREVFWKLGDLAPGSAGNFALRLSYEWGLKIGLQSTIAAQLSGSNISPQPFDLAAYLSYESMYVTNKEDLTAAQVDADRAAHADLATLYTQATGEGFVFGSAEQQTYSTGEVLRQAILLKFDPVTKQMSAFLLWWQGDSATGVRVDGSSFEVYKPGRGLRYDLLTNQWQEVAAASQVADGVTWHDCMNNCIEEKLPGYIIKKYIKILGTASKVVNCVAAAKGDAKDIASCTKIIGKVLPGYGEAVDLGLCNSDCQGCEAAGQGCDDDRCHCCNQDKYRCSSDDWLYGTFGIDVVMVRRCGATKHYLAEEVTQVCALCEKCLDGEGGPRCIVKPSQSPSPVSQLQPATVALPLLSPSYVQQCERCVVAADPNEMHGPEGDLLPGQLVTYTIDYENVGAGDAFDVFIVNDLSEHFDLATLQLPDEAIVSTAARVVYFQVGDLAPKGQPGSTGKVTYSVRLKSGLPSGTVITNQAVVHFPSVPEETPTNVVANLVAPLVAQSQTLTATAGKPLAIVLQGRDVSGKPLTFALVETPLYGVLTGTPPALTYTPASGFAGQDRLLFTVNNGTATSQPTEVTLLVQPAPGDKTAPTVRWTSPANNERVDSRLLAGGDKPYYAPVIQVQFSEAMAPDSFAGNAVQMIGPNSQPLALDVSYDPVIDQAVLLLRQAPKADAAYTVTVMRNVTDLSGNALPADVSWTFEIGTGSITPASTLFLPAIRR